MAARKKKGKSLREELRINTQIRGFPGSSRRGRLSRGAMIERAKSLRQGELDGRQAARLKAAQLEKLGTQEILDELVRRGGAAGETARAALLSVKKSQDYDLERLRADGHKDRDAYFPLGLASYAQMVHVKSQRLVSMAVKTLAGAEPNFESALDTCHDLVNYASFCADWLRRSEDQRPPL
jgi:hypothetical protein